jgi:hypothetical protein
MLPASPTTSKGPNPRGRSKTCPYENKIPTKTQVVATVFHVKPGVEVARVVGGGP